MATIPDKVCDKAEFFAFCIKGSEERDSCHN
jgi:hypothetical protein